MKRAPNARWTRIFGLAGLLTLLRRVRRRADAKELAIESREQLFSMLVRNADDIYVMFSPDAYEVEYVSPNVEKLFGRVGRSGEEQHTSAVGFGGRSIVRPSNR